ncbi:MAG: sporulation protein [Firmicutes bacterium]|nr:sporulation protein [Bacillota bacterium]
MPKKLVTLLITLILVLGIATSVLAQPKAASVGTDYRLYEQVYRQVYEQVERQLGGWFDKSVVDSLSERLTQQILAQLGAQYQIPTKQSEPTPESNTKSDPKPITPKPEPNAKPEQTSVKPTPEQLAAEEARLLELTNQARKEAGLQPLQLDMRLVETARAKSADMVANDYFGHISPDLGSPFDQMHQAGITYQTAGENLAGAPTADAAHTGLMNSPGHRANILNPNFTHIGIGMAKGSSYGLIFTQQFIG